MCSLLFTSVVRGAQGKRTLTSGKNSPSTNHKLINVSLFIFYFFLHRILPSDFLYFSVAQFRQRVSHFYANSKCRRRKMFLLYLVELFTPNKLLSGYKEGEIGSYVLALFSFPEEAISLMPPQF